MTHPDDRTEDVDIEVGDNDSFTVRFVPRMNGIHTLSVKKDDEDVQGRLRFHLSSQRCTYVSIIKRVFY